MRGRLAVVALAVSTMVTIAFLVPLALLVRDAARDRALTAATRDAGALAPALALTTEPAELDAAIARTRSGEAGRVTVHLPDGRRVGAPHAADEDVVRAREQKVAFRHDDAGRIDLYQPVVLPGGTAVIEISVPDGDLRRGVVRSWLALGAVAVVLVAGAVAVADRLARSVVRPTRRLAAAAAELGGGNLGVRVTPDGPEEVAEVGAAFNLLAQRVGVLLANERELVADLSHRLRTPLTALRLDAEALGDGAAAARVREDADRLEATVTAIIEDVRRPHHEEPAGRCHPHAVVAERVAFWAPLAEDQGRAWQVDLDTAAPAVGLPAAELAAALDALLGNVFAHTPEGAAVLVRLVADDHAALVVVEDGGSGMPPGAAVRGSSGAGSTGLGLDIVRRTVAAAGGDMQVAGSPLGGAQVTLRVPVAESDV